MHTLLQGLCCCSECCHALIEVLVLVGQSIQVKLHSRVSPEPFTHHIHLLLKAPELHPPGISTIEGNTKVGHAAACKVQGSAARELPVTNALLLLVRYTAVGVLNRKPSSDLHGSQAAAAAAMSTAA
jgi:hypothetical protein